MVQLAIRFGVLTAARQGEVRRATWDEFDLGGVAWAVPAAHMKRGRAHRVQLSTGALAVLNEARRLSGGGDGLVLPGPGGELGKSTVPTALVHGFRSSYKDWARHEGVDELLSEFALAHVEGSRTVPPTRLEKRCPVMQKWAECVTV